MLGAAAAGEDWIVTGSNGVLAGVLFTPGQPVFEHGLLCGMKDHVLNSLHANGDPLAVEGLRLAIAERDYRVRLILSLPDDKKGLIAKAFEDRNTGVRLHSEQKRRSARVFGEIHQAMSDRADALRAHLRREIELYPEKPQTAGVQQLWRSEGLADEFAELVKRSVTEKPAVDIDPAYFRRSPPRS